MDKVTWYSVTPETIARHHARRFRDALPDSPIVLDAFLGGAGNAIQLALAKLNVIAIESDASRLDIAINNARVYGVAEKIEFLHGNAYQLLPLMKGIDAVLLSPPWGGPQINRLKIYDASRFLKLVKKARVLTPNIAMLLPKKINFRQVLDIFGECEVEQNWDEDGKIRMCTIYFGCLMKNVTTKESGPTIVNLKCEEVEEEDKYCDVVSPVKVQKLNVGELEIIRNTVPPGEDEEENNLVDEFEHALSLGSSTTSGR